MKIFRVKSILSLSLFLFLVVSVGVNAEFRDNFADKTMRIDYFHTADKTSEFITLDKIYLQGPGEGIWAGNPDYPVHWAKASPGIIILR